MSEQREVIEMGAQEMPRGHVDGRDYVVKGTSCGRTVKKYLAWCLVGVLFIAVVCLIVYSSQRSNSNTAMTGSTSGLSGLLLGKDNSQSVHLSVGMRNDYLMQACGEPELKQSFPDVDYALYGYNTLKGFPLSAGHDPGFSLPMFVADYSQGRQSADCRYSVPLGLAIVPDVSCVTSFTSKVIESTRAYSESLSVSASISGGGFGSSFSLSGGYQTAKSEIEQKKKVFIMSTAHCNYYVSKFVAINPPAFHPDFLRWVRKLERANDVDSYIEFYDTFGTHYPTETTFGARYTYEYRMTQSKFETKKQQSANIQMAASYSGSFSVGASFGLSSEQKQEASDFSKDIEKRTYTVGAAPPADGDAMRWASSVQANPVPVAYSLAPIQDLFTDNFMGSLNINFQHIHRHLIKYKFDYYEYLFYKAGLAFCPATKQSDNIVLKLTRLTSYPEKHTCSFCECMTLCANTTCIAVSFSGNRCWLYSGGKDGYRLRANNETEWVTILSPKPKQRKTVFTQAKVVGEPLGEVTGVLTTEDCENLCEVNEYCDAVTYSMKSCILYRRKDIEHLQEATHAATSFMHIKHIPTIS